MSELENMSRHVSKPETRHKPMGLNKYGHIVLEYRTFKESFTMVTNRSVADKRSHAWGKGRGITEVTRTWFAPCAQAD